jgi:hypothetical protein
MVKIIITAKTKGACEAKRESYFRAYHPAGYGTTIFPPVKQADGTWTAAGARDSSCD